MAVKELQPGCRLEILLPSPPKKPGRRLLGFSAPVVFCGARAGDKNRAEFGIAGGRKILKFRQGG